MAAPLLEKSKATISVSNTVITVSIPLSLFPTLNNRDNVAYEHAIAFAPTKYLICITFVSISFAIFMRQRYKIMKILNVINDVIDTNKNMTFARLYAAWHRLNRTSKIIHGHNML